MEGYKFSTEPPPSSLKITLPERSEWKCYLFGGSDDNCSIVWYPNKGKHPRWLTRLMMRWFFQCRWVREAK